MLKRANKSSSSISLFTVEHGWATRLVSSSALCQCKKDILHARLKHSWFLALLLSLKFNFSLPGHLLPFLFDLSFKAAPPWLSFWSFLTFLHHCIEEVETHLLWKFHKKIRRKSWSNVPPKLLAYIRFYTKLYTKSAVSESSIVLGRLHLTFLPLRLSLWNLAHLFIMFMATKFASDFFTFCLGT